MENNYYGADFSRQQISPQWSSATADKGWSCGFHLISFPTKKGTLCLHRIPKLNIHYGKLLPFLYRDL